MSSMQHPPLIKTAEAIRDVLKTKNVSLTNFKDVSDKNNFEQGLRHINFDILVSQNDHIGLTLTYDGWGLTLHHSNNTVSNLLKGIDVPSTNEEYFKIYYERVLNNAVQAVLAFTQGHVAAVVHSEKDIPKIMCLYERTIHGYEYLTWRYTQNPKDHYTSEQPILFNKKEDGFWAIHPKCDAIMIQYDSLPTPSDKLTKESRKLFESFELKSSMKAAEHVIDLHQLKPINQEVALLDQ